MKKMTLMGLIGIGMLVFWGGCGNQGKCEGVSKKGENPRIANFPKCMVGTWSGQDPNDKNSKWSFTFDKTGQLTMLKHHFTDIPFVVKEGGVYEQLPHGATGIYTLGPCNANYNPATKELSVKVSLSYFRMESVAHEVLEGSCEDTLAGNVSENCKEWSADWYTRIQLEGIKTSETPPELFKKLVFHKSKK